MIQIIFKNMDKSTLARDTVEERLASVIERFPDLAASRLKVTLIMENSPLHAGPDLFKVRLNCLGGRYDSVALEKSSSSLYVALADVVEHLLERLNRFGDRARVKKRKKARESQKTLLAHVDQESEAS